MRLMENMNASQNSSIDQSESGKNGTPFSQTMVQLSKQEYIQIKWDSRYWRRQHDRAIAREAVLINRFPVLSYTIERVISDHTYNDLQPWKYHKLVEVFGGGLGLDVHTEGELEDALTKAATADDLVFIEIHTGRLDCPESLRSAGQSMAKTNQLD